MPATVLYMSMSLDGFIAGPNERLDNGLGDGGERLHDWVFARPGGGDAGGRPTAVDGQDYDESLATGAVVCGRGTIEPAHGWDGDHSSGSGSAPAPSAFGL